MKKKLLLGVLALFVNTFCFAQSNCTESLTITTYYPAPYGVYNTMKVRKMVVGDPQYANATFAGALTIKPITNPPAANTQPIGTLYFDDGDKTYKYYNGTGGWQTLGIMTPENMPAGSWAGYVKISQSDNQASCTSVQSCSKISAPGHCTCSPPVWGPWGSCPHGDVQCSASCDSGWQLVRLSHTWSMHAGGIGVGEDIYSCFKE